MPKIEKCSETNALKDRYVVLSDSKMEGSVSYGN